MLLLQFAQGPYFFWVLDLVRTYGRHTLILVEYNHISLRLHSSKVLFDDAALLVHDVLLRAGFSKACVVGHSFGTFVASRLHKLHPEVSFYSHKLLSSGQYVCRFQQYVILLVCS